ncbi:AI-2E family transporter, partial [Clostridium tepidum]
KLMFWSVELLVLAALVFVSSKISFLFSPIVTFVSTLFAPVLVAGFLYYMLNPLVNRFKKLGLSRNKSILIVFLLLIGGIALLI